MLVIPLAVTARDEARALPACLDSLLAAARVAERELPVRIAPVVVLDRCRDTTGAIAATRGVRTLVSEGGGGKVEAQRTAVRACPAAVHLFSDADVLVTPDTLAALCEVMLAEPGVRVATPPRMPLPPRSQAPLARALHVYNARRGFSSGRAWFSGKLFAIRGWAVPDAADIARRAARLPPRRFEALAAPLTVDDVYLSRRIVHDHGAAALRETTRGLLSFRAPETWRGMYRYYRRMRRELARVDALFPELRVVAPRVPDLLAAATDGERRAWRMFELALAACRVAYRAEQLAVDRLGAPVRDPWPAIAETKAL